MHQDLLKKVDEAVLLREQGDLDKSHDLFEKILTDVESLKISQNPEDQKLYIGIIGQWVIQLRHEAKQKGSESFRVSKEVYKYGKISGLSDSNMVRGLGHTLIDLGAYEMAEPFVREMISIVPQDESAKLGDEQAHLAICLFRTGKVEQAAKLADESLKNLEANTEKSSDFNISVWKSHALLVKALIANGQDQKDLAKSLAADALNLAKSTNAVVRIEQATALVNFFSKQ